MTDDVDNAKNVNTEDIDISYDEVIDELVNLRSNELAGTTLRGLIEEIAKDLDKNPDKVVADDSYEDDDEEFVAEFKKGSFKKIARMIAKSIEDECYERTGNIACDESTKDLIDRANTELFFGTARQLVEGERRGLPKKIFKELPKRLGLTVGA